MSHTIPLEQVRLALELEIARAGSGQALAKKWGIAQSSISAVCKGRTPGPMLLEKLRLRRVVRYERVDAEAR